MAVAPTSAAPAARAARGTYSLSRRYDSLHASLHLLYRMGVAAPPGTLHAALATALFDYLYNSRPQLYREDELSGHAREARVFLSKLIGYVDRLGLPLLTRGDYEMAAAVAASVHRLLEELFGGKKDGGKNGPGSQPGGQKGGQDVATPPGSKCRAPRLGQAGLAKLAKRLADIARKAGLAAQYASTLRDLDVSLWGGGMGRGDAVSLIFSGEVDEERLRLARSLLVEIRAYRYELERPDARALPWPAPVRDPADLPDLAPEDLAVLASESGPLLLAAGQLLRLRSDVGLSGTGEEPPRRLVILVDKSGSTAGATVRTLAAAGIALAAYVRRRGGDAAVVLFDVKPYDITRMGTLDVLGTLLRVRGTGGTNIGAAVKYVGEAYPGYRVVLLTDGLDDPPGGGVDAAVILNRDRGAVERYGWRIDGRRVILATNLDELRAALRRLTLHPPRPG